MLDTVIHVIDFFNSILRGNMLFRALCQTFGTLMLINLRTDLEM